MPTSTPETNPLEPVSDTPSPVADPTPPSDPVPEESTPDAATPSEPDMPSVDTLPDDPGPEPSEPTAGPPSTSEQAPASTSLPGDCLLARTVGSTVCYTPGTRELLSVNGDGQTRWRFALPGDDTTNHIRSIAFAQSRIVIAATTTSSAGDRGVEFSTFGIDGRFLDTHPVELPLQPQRQRVRAASLRAFGFDAALYLTGELDATSNGDGGGPRVFLARLDADTGTKEAFRSWTDGSVPSIEPGAGNDIRVIRDGLSFDLDSRSLSAVSSPQINAGSYESVFSEVRRHLEGDWLRRLDQVRRSLSQAIGPSITPAPGTPVPCPNSGTVRSFTNASGGNEAVYERCGVGPYEIDGRVATTNIVTNSSLQIVREYENLTLSSGRLAFWEVTLDAQITRSSFGAGRQACQGSGSESIEVQLERFGLRSSRDNVAIQNGSYRQSSGLSGSYNPNTRECEYEDADTGSAWMTITGLFDDDRSWLVNLDRSSATSARLTVTASDRSELTLSGALDGLVLDDASIGGSDAVVPYRPSWRLDRISGVWGFD